MKGLKRLALHCAWPGKGEVSFQARDLGLLLFCRWRGQQWWDGRSQQTPNTTLGQGCYCHSTTKGLAVKTAQLLLLEWLPLSLSCQVWLQLGPRSLEFASKKRHALPSSADSTGKHHTLSHTQSQTTFTPFIAASWCSWLLWSIPSAGRFPDSRELGNHFVVLLPLMPCQLCLYFFCAVWVKFKHILV